MFEQRVQNYDLRVDPSKPNNATSKFIRLIPRGSRVLEVGCANGVVSAYLTQQMNCEVVGIELNPEAASVAKKHCSSVVVGDVEKDALDVVQGDFDVITFGDVLEHLVLPGVVLARCRKLLGEDGFILVSIPNVAHYSVRLRLLRGKFDYEQYGLLDRTHLRFFTARTARQMLAESGYQISVFDATCSARGWRLIQKCAPVRSFLERHLTGLIGYQLIFKAFPVRDGRGQADHAFRVEGSRQPVKT